MQSRCSRDAAEMQPRGVAPERATRPLTPSSPARAKATAPSRRSPSSRPARSEGSLAPAQAPALAPQAVPAATSTFAASPLRAGISSGSCAPCGSTRRQTACASSSRTETLARAVQVPRSRAQFAAPPSRSQVGALVFGAIVAAQLLRGAGEEAGEGEDAEGVGAEGDAENADRRGNRARERHLTGFDVLRSLWCGEADVASRVRRAVGFAAERGGES